MFSMAILSKKCQECKYMATCDYKEVEEVGFLPLPENIEEAKQALSNGDSDVGFYGLDFASLPDKTGLMTPLSYAKGFAKNHELPLYEALKQPMVEAYRQAYVGFMSPSLNMTIVSEGISSADSSINQHPEEPLDKRLIFEPKIPSADILAKSVNAQLNRYKCLMKNGG